ncbi:MAG TPA: FAD:protein FMN transferase [Thermoanaerobaculia bacterium]|nr:FAD:protein FMN transferase [Thermoanaerobaculia bacterium]
MGTVCEVSAADGRQVEAAFAEAARVEAMLSTWRNDSELSRVNSHTSVPGPELASLLDVVETWREKSGGAFDPHVRGLIDVWKTREGGAVPTAAEIAKARARKEIEEGAFGKGYALDRMLEKLDGDAILNFGGQLLVRGSYEVTIADPEHRDVPLYKLTLTDASLSTSSGSEKTFVIDGHVFTHIFDPRTGEALPPRGSVSVIASSALLADIQSTALYVMGAGEGLHWADSNGVAALFITRDGLAHPSRAFPKFKRVKD